MCVRLILSIMLDFKNRFKYLDYVGIHNINITYICVCIHDENINFI